MHELFQLTGLVLKTSVILQVLAIGLGASWHDATYLFRRPRLLWNSMLARNVAAPIIAFLLIKALALHPAVAIALGVLAVAPAPPLLLRSQLPAGARSEYLHGLVVSQAVMAVVLVPVTIRLMNWALGDQSHFSAGQVAVIVLQTILLPLAVGMLAARLFPKIQRIAQDLMMAGTIWLIAGAIPLLLLAWKEFGALVGNFTLLAIVVFVAAGATVGHLLGGPRPEDRTTLALATAARHPGIAIAIAHANFPEQTIPVAGAVVIYLILRIVLSLPYMKWRRTVHA